MSLSLRSNIGREWASAGLTIRQNKNMLRESRGKGTPQKSGHKVIQIKHTNKCYRAYNINMKKIREI
jgi:hypothetical protein